MVRDRCTGIVLDSVDSVRRHLCCAVVSAGVALVAIGAAVACRGPLRVPVMEWRVGAGGRRAGARGEWPYGGAAVPLCATARQGEARREARGRALVQQEPRARRGEHGGVLPHGETQRLRGDHGDAGAARRARELHVRGDARLRAPQRGCVRAGGPSGARPGHGRAARRARDRRKCTAAVSAPSPWDGCDVAGRVCAASDCTLSAPCGSSVAWNVPCASALQFRCI